jgi:hypothetical protein
MAGGIQQTRPQTRREFMQTLQMPYAQQSPDQVFTEPQKLGQPEFNRALEYSLKGDKDSVFSVGIKDIDDAVMYYFTEVLKPSVVQNNTRLNVPVMYGTPENWSSVQADGYHRDQKGKGLAPLIMFKRNSVSQNRSLGNKIDGNQAHNLQFFEKKYTARNQYSNFAVLNNRVPEKEYLVSITPDYVTVEYTCMVWTYFVEQMDSLIESLNFASRSYWGDPTRFLFYSNIESFTDTLSYDLGDDRLVRNSFTLTLNGYLIPNTEMSKVAGASKSYGISKLIFGLETTDSVSASISNKNPLKGNVKNTVQISDSMNVVYNVTSGVDAAIIAYLMKNEQRVAALKTTNTAIFNSGWLSAPSGLPPTSLSNFTFFINGNFIENIAIISFVDNGNGTSTLILDPIVLGYELDINDLVLGMGKFN